MSLFSECFTNMKDSRNLTAAQIAQNCKKDVKEIFHWLNGKRIPSNWNQIENVIDKLQLSVEEVKRLKSAYERTIMGKDAYACHQKMIEILNVLQQRRNEYLSSQKGMLLGIREVKLPDFLRLNNKMEILGCIQIVLEHLETQNEKKLFLKIQTAHPEVLMLLKMFCSHTKECHIEEIVYLIEGEKESEIHNLEVLKGIVELMVQRNSIEIFCHEELNYEKGFSDNWILSEDFALQFDEELSGGMLFANSQWVQFFLKTFETIKGGSRSLGKRVYETTKDDYDFAKRNVVRKSIGFMPFMEEQFIEDIIEDGNGSWSVVFAREGLLQFIENKQALENHGTAYETTDIKVGRELLAHAIKFTESGKISFYMIKGESLPEMRDLHIEQIDEKTIYIDIILKEGVKERFIIEDSGIGKQFLKRDDRLSNSVFYKQEV